MLTFLKTHKTEVVKDFYPPKGAQSGRGFTTGRSQTIIFAHVMAACLCVGLSPSNMGVTDSLLSTVLLLQDSLVTEN